MDDPSSWEWTARAGSTRAPCYDGPGGLWVRSRLIKGEIDDRFHALERDGSLLRAPGHISWNVWLDGAWRQMAIIQGEGLETLRGAARAVGWPDPPRPAPLPDVPAGARRAADRRRHRPGDDVARRGRLRRGRPAVSLAKSCSSGAAVVQQATIPVPDAPDVIKDDGSGEHRYALIAVGPQGRRTAASIPSRAGGLATLRWDGVPGADCYIVVRDGVEHAGPLRLEGSRKEWTDRSGPSGVRRGPSPP